MSDKPGAPGRGSLVLPRLYCRSCKGGEFAVYADFAKREVTTRCEGCGGVSLLDLGGSVPIEKLDGKRIEGIAAW